MDWIRAAASLVKNCARMLLRLPALLHAHWQVVGRLFTVLKAARAACVP